MKVNFDKTYITVLREPGDPRANTEAHFWFLLRNHLNGLRCAPLTSLSKRWRRVRPCETPGNLTGMPFALAQGRRWDRLISDGYYATRDPKTEYNAGLQVTLDYSD